MNSKPPVAHGSRSIDCLSGCPTLLNKIAVAWYEKLGFKLLLSWQTDLYRKSVGHAIDLLVYGLKL